MDLIERDEVILIRGNHEDLLEDMIDTWDEMSYLEKENISNGTAETILRLTRSPLSNLLTDPKAILKKFLETPAMKVILPSMKDYHETEHYIFTHGWIPARQYFTEHGEEIYLMDPDWRNAGKEEWIMARWTNGMLAHHSGVWESGKTIFCGHWHTSFAHSRYEGKGPEFGPGEDFSPYIAEGITALDACTAHTGKVNVVIAEEE